MSSIIISQQLNTETIPPTPHGQTTPLETYCQVVDNAIHRLIGYRALLMKAQMAGLETVNLEDPDTGQLHTVALELAIEAVDFLCQVKRGGAA